jgi:rhodanese-related sulfurtransferase
MKEVTAVQLREMKEKGEDFQLIDIREEFEYDMGHIGGELIPMGTVFDQTERIRREKPVVIYCRSGNRSTVIIRELEGRFGFTNLYNLQGGILAWARDVDPSLTV